MEKGEGAWNKKEGQARCRVITFPSIPSCLAIAPGARLCMDKARAVAAGRFGGAFVKQERGEGLGTEKGRLHLLFKWRGRAAHTMCYIYWQKILFKTWTERQSLCGGARAV